MSSGSNPVAPPAISSSKRKQHRRPDIPNRRLLAMTVAVPVLLIVYFVALPWLPQAMRTPGSPALYLTGAAGTLLLLVAAAFVVVKRTGRGGSPVAWFLAHIGCGTLGLILVAIHTTGKMDRPPALLLLSLFALMALGVWARVRASRSMADTFGTKLRGFAAHDPAARTTLQRIIADKTALLAKLDPSAAEPTFSVTLSHVVHHPGMAFAYMRLARAEAALLGTRRSVGWAQAWWRPLHLALAAAFTIGLAIHVVMVTFFAGYVADGGPVTWWHVTAWDF